MTNINPVIFKAYDIRGRWPEEFNENNLEDIINAYLTVIGQKLNHKTNQLTIALGKDIRPGSEIIYSKTIDLLLERGVRVVALDYVSVNDLYFSVGYYSLNGGLMATASHNPSGYAGLKMTAYTGDKNAGLDFITGQEIKENLEKKVATTEKGHLEKKDVVSDHVAWLLKQIDYKQIKPFKIVLDTGGGMNIILLAKLLAQLPLDCAFVNADFDTSFSKRAPNPLTPGATTKAKEILLTNKADLGLIYDIDGDRFFLLDEKGELVKGDMVLLIIAEYLLKLKANSSIIYNSICSKSVPEKILAWGGKPIRSKVGYKNLTEAMKKNNGIMSGEVSSHFAFADHWYADSAFLATLYALLSISIKNKPLSEIVKNNKIWHRADEVNLEVSDQATLFTKLKTHFSDGVIDELDGLTIAYDNWWFNVRASNTEPLIRVTVEAKTEKDLPIKQKELLLLIESCLV
jgi:phosphomannomutase